MDILGLTLKGMGFDPAALLAQAAQLGAAFQAVTESLERIEAHQLAIMSALGLYVAPPSGKLAQLIADESRAYVQRVELVTERDV